MRQRISDSNKFAFAKKRKETTKEKLDNKSNIGISFAGSTSKFEIIYMNLFLYIQVGILSTLI